MAELKMPPGTVISGDSLVFDVEGKPWWVDADYKTVRQADLNEEEDSDEEDEDADEEQNISGGRDHD